MPHEHRYKNPQQQTKSSTKYYKLNSAIYKNPRSNKDLFQECKAIQYLKLISTFPSFINQCHPNDFNQIN